MIRRMRFNLSAQLVFGFVMLALLTTIATGIPAIQSINDRLEKQAWVQVEQGARASKALFAATENDVQNLATLTAQRPTLLELLREDRLSALPDYLRTLRNAAGLDMILLCDNEARLLAFDDDIALPSTCADFVQRGYHFFDSDGSTSAMLTGMDTTFSGDQENVRVIVGLLLDDAFVHTMRSQTEMEHTLWLNNQILASSFSPELNTDETHVPSRLKVRTEGIEQTRISYNDGLFYASQFSLGEAGLQIEVALDVTEIAATRSQLAWRFAASILIIAAAGSTLGVFLARRIGSSFQDLSKVATNFSRGDLDTPVQLASHVSEALLLAQTLEKARLDLNHIMRQLREEKAWGDHLLEAIVEGIVTLDSKNNITFFSSGAERISGWSEDQVLNQPCDRFFKPVDHEQPFTDLVPPPGQRRRIVVQMAAGKSATLALSGARLAPTEAHKAEVVFVFRDISEEDAVHRLMGHFMANISHEFRTPLTALAASIELLLEEGSDLSAGEMQELLNSLHLGLLSLQTLVDNLIESASIETGHFRVSPRTVDLQDIMGEAIAILQPLLAKHEKHLNVQLPMHIPKVRADSRRSTQVIVNLLSNANKYTPQGSEITIRASRENDSMKVEIIDQGPGVPEEKRADIFRRFAYLVQDNDAPARYGAGLGLSVVKAIIDAQGGTVGVEDNPDGGSIFWFTLPTAGET